MGGQATTLLAIALIFGALILGVFYASRYLLKQAMRSVVSTLREQGATSPATAKTPQELGLVQRGLVEGMFRLRDYKPEALRLLQREDVVKATNDGRLYLSEDELGRSRVKGFAKIE